MKFFNARIVTKQVPLGAALKAESKPARTLDEILADIQQKGQVKTAAAVAPQVKTAAKAPTAEEKKAEAPKVEVKEAKKDLPDFIQKKIDEKAGKKDEKKDKKDDKGEKDEKKDKKASASPRTIKMSKSLDFRGWEAEDVVKAWGQHGSHEKCVANVKKLVNEPATYCKLLHVASNKAASIVKTAAVKMAKSLDFRGWEAEDVVKAWGQHGSHEKCVANVKKLVNEPATYCKLLHVASNKAASIVKTAAVKKASPKGVFKKLAKLSDEETAFLKKYWTELYGSEYVESMMKDY